MVLEKALKETKENWSRWEDVYTQRPQKLQDSLLFNDSRILLGFCKEYSVFRRRLDETLRLARWLRGCGNPHSFEDFHRKLTCKFPLNGHKEKLISLASKILCKWNPEEYVMWDTFARRGLARLKRANKSLNEQPQIQEFSNFSTSQTDYQKYCAYRSAFFAACNHDKEFVMFFEKQADFKQAKGSNIACLTTTFLI